MSPPWGWGSPVHGSRRQLPHSSQEHTVHAVKSPRVFHAPPSALSWRHFSTASRNRFDPMCCVRSVCVCLCVSVGLCVSVCVESCVCVCCVLCVCQHAKNFRNTFATHPITFATLFATSKNFRHTPNTFATRQTCSQQFRNAKHVRNTQASATFLRSLPPATKTEDDCREDGGHSSIGVDVAPAPVVQLLTA